ncbi:hypothetical protein GGR54DRAFT_651334 [Hypoxylon sp. NC1633]|nr:hypothetical protein GGR54DRAFT_651334 [Hypoxylon sp. NC1633]
MTAPEFSQRFLLGLSAEDFDDLKSAELADRIASYFMPNPTLTYGGILGMGGNGGALLFREWNEETQTSRKIVVKYSLNERADIQLRNEAECLAMLRGAEHIVQMISLPGAEVNVAGTGKRPTIALEYLPFGDAIRFRGKLADHFYQVTPSRLLWRFLLCIIRSRIAMAYPPRALPGAPAFQEVIWDDMETFGLTQNSPHGGNIVFGNFSFDLEHQLTPILKQIDFGRGGITDDPQFAHYLNMFSTGLLMCYLALPATDATEIINFDYTENEPVDYTLQTGAKIRTYCHQDLLATRNIDWALRDMIALLMAPDYIPPLEIIVQFCTNGVYNRGVPDIVNEHFSQLDRERESDESIQELMRTVFLDGDVMETPIGFTRPTMNVQTGTTLVGLLDSESWRQIRMLPNPPRAEDLSEEIVYAGFIQSIRDLYQRLKTLREAGNPDDVQ